MTECKFIRFTVNGKTSVVKKEHLYAFLFTIGSEEEQRKMIPKVETRSRWYETKISVKAKKDIKKGEEITFPLKLSLPTFSEEIIAEAKREAKHGLLTGKIN